MITFVQFLITGLRLGSVYALIALGYTMVYGIIKLMLEAARDDVAPQVKDEFLKWLAKNYKSTPKKK